MPTSSSSIDDPAPPRQPGGSMNERRARRTVTRREAGGRRPLTTAAFAPVTGEPFPFCPAVSLSRESGMGHPDAVRPPPAVSPFDHRVRVGESSSRVDWQYMGFWEQPARPEEMP